MGIKVNSFFHSNYKKSNLKSKMKIISSLMMTLVWSRSLGTDRIGADRIGTDRVEPNHGEQHPEPVKTLPNRIFYENQVGPAGNQLDDRREPTNKDLQIIMHSLFQRMVFEQYQAIIERSTHESYWSSKLSIQRKYGFSNGFPTIKSAISNAKLVES